MHKPNPEGAPNNSPELPFYWLQTDRHAVEIALEFFARPQHLSFKIQIVKTPTPIIINCN